MCAWTVGGLRNGLRWANHQGLHGTPTGFGRCPFGEERILSAFWEGGSLGGPDHDLCGGAAPQIWEPGCQH